MRCNKVILWLLAPLALAACSSPPPSSNPWSQEPYLLLGLGDSVTAGFGASRGQAYFDRLHTELAQHLPRLQARNLAVSGSTSQGALAQQLPRLEPQSMKGLVVLTTGGNDVLHNYGRSSPRDGAMYGSTPSQAQPWISAYSQRLDALLGGLEGKFPAGLTVFVGNIYDPTDGVGDIENAGLSLPPWPGGLTVLLKMNETTAEVCGRHQRARLLDVHATFRDHGIHHKRDYWYYANLEDPNDKGYAALYHLFLDRITKELKP